MEEKARCLCSVLFGRFPFFTLKFFLVVVGGRCEKKVRKERSGKEGRGERGEGEERGEKFLGTKKRRALNARCFEGERRGARRGRSERKGCVQTGPGQ